jgi:hypothetical protein
MLTPIQLRTLEDDGWYLACGSPFELEKDNGFNLSRITDVEEAIKMAHAINVSNTLRKTMMRKEKDENKEKKEKYIKDFKNTVRKLIDTGITVDTLFEFYLHSNNFGWKFYPSKACLKKCLTEVIEGK